MHVGRQLRLLGVERLRAVWLASTRRVRGRHPDLADDAAEAITLVRFDPNRLIVGERGKSLLGPLTTRLPALGRVDTGKADTVLDLAGIEDGDRVAISNADDSADDDGLCRRECRRDEECCRNKDPTDRVTGSAAPGTQGPCMPA